MILSNNNPNNSPSNSGTILNNSPTTTNSTSSNSSNNKFNLNFFRKYSFSSNKNKPSENQARPLVDTAVVSSVSNTSNSSDSTNHSDINRENPSPLTKTHNKNGSVSTISTSQSSNANGYCVTRSTNSVSHANHANHNCHRVANPFRRNINDFITSEVISLNSSEMTLSSEDLTNPAPTNKCKVGGYSLSNLAFLKNKYNNAVHKKPSAVTRADLPCFTRDHNDEYDEQDFGDSDFYSQTDGCDIDDEEVAFKAASTLKHDAFIPQNDIGANIGVISTHNANEDAYMQKRNDNNEFNEMAEDDDDDDDETFNKFEEEDENSYGPGGYHPVFENEIYVSEKKKYKIVRKLGWGHFSTVWLAQELLSNDYVAIKFVKSSPTYTEAAIDEIKILRLLQNPREVTYLNNKHKKYLINHPGSNKFIKLLDSFIHEGPNGSHVCMVFDVLGENILNLIKKYREIFKFMNDIQKARNSLNDYKMLNAPSEEQDKSNGKVNALPKLSQPFELYSNIKTNEDSKQSKSNIFKKITPKSLLKLSNLSNSIDGDDSDYISASKSKESLASDKKLITAPSSPKGLSLSSSLVSKDTNKSESNRAHSISDNGIDFVSFIKTTDDLTLSKLINNCKSFGGLPLILVKQIAKQLLVSLDYLHHCCIIHTDLKPENILIEIKDINKLIKLIEIMELEAKVVKKYNKEKDRENEKSKSKEKPSDLVFDYEEAIELTDSTPFTAPPSTPNISESSTFKGPVIHRSRKSFFKNSFNSPIKCSKPLPSPITATNFFRQQSINASSGSYGESVLNNNINSVNISNINLNFSFDSSFKFPITCDDNGDQIMQGNLSMNSGENSYSSDTTSPANNREDEYRKMLENINLMKKSILEKTDDEDDILSIKIADLGNACFTHHHFSNEIQTRQYRSPEIILGYKSWGASTDIWSIGCIIFELITGDFLFDPKSGSNFAKDDDHVAQMIELLGFFPDSFDFDSCNNFKKFFHDRYNLKKIKNLKHWDLKNVLVEKYNMTHDNEISLIVDFLLKCLVIEPEKRFDSSYLSNHKWLDNCGINSVLKKDDDAIHGEDIPGWYRENHI